ncbi:MAG: hypothetical protein KJ749_00030 [Planctomycetes bacterium]|nr:hypothetical protein [Planctomycetota bacterium]
MRRTLQIMLVVTLASCGMAHAGPVLLAYFDQTSGVASAGTAPPPEHRAQFVLELTPYPAVLGPRVGLGVFWEDGDSGVFDFTAETDNGFVGFADFATNGIDDWLMDLILFPGGGGGGGGAPESVRLGTSPDLSGYRLALVRLIVHDVTIESFSPEDQPDLEGTRVLGHLTYEFYGTVIPEPTTLCLLATGAALVMRRSLGA